MRDVDRRKFLKTAALGLVAGHALPKESFLEEETFIETNDDAVAISSANGLATVETAYSLMMEQSMRPVSAAVRGVAIVEADPQDLSVGYGGLPNELGVVQLDASCMDGPTHNAGSVACIEDIKHPAQVAELVMDRTDHVNLVGRGARQFAIDHGFPVENLLTERARKIWLKWRSARTDDDRLWPLRDTDPADPALADQARPWGTIHCSALNMQGDLGCCTTTSGLAFKIPGRIGDSPLVGAGMYCDNAIGSAGATGRGEAAILSGGSMMIVERMRMGDHPVEACLNVLKRIAEQAKRGAAWQPSLSNNGVPSFGLTFYAVRKDGSYGAATMNQSGSLKFAVADKNGARLEDCAILFD